MPCYLVHGFRWPRRAIRIHIIMENIDEAAAEYLSEPVTSAAMLESLHDKFPGEMALLPRLRFVEQYDPLDTSPRALSQPYAFVVDEARAIDLSLNVLDGMREMEEAMATATATADAREDSGVGRHGQAENGTVEAEHGSRPARRGAGEKARSGARIKNGTNKATAATQSSPPSTAAADTGSNGRSPPHDRPRGAAEALEKLRKELAPDEKIGWWVVYNGDERRGIETVLPPVHKEAVVKDEQAKYNKKGLRKFFRMSS